MQRTNLTRTLSATALLSALAITPATAQTADKAESWKQADKNASKSTKTSLTSDEKVDAMAATADNDPAQIKASVDPYQQPDESWITLTGTILNPTVEGFELGYDDTSIIVETDSFLDWINTYQFVEGEEVTVLGKVDNDFWENASIEASTVFVDSLNTNLYASPADEEDYPRLYGYLDRTPGQLMLEGSVDNIYVAENAFDLKVGGQIYRIDVVELEDNPLDTNGYQRLIVGDDVLVSGMIDKGFFEQDEVVATRIVTLTNNGRDHSAS